MKNILEKLKYYLIEEDSFIIQGGYFDVTKGIDSFSKTSYQDSLILSKALISWGKENIDNIVLINNIQRKCKKITEEKCNDMQNNLIKSSMDTIYTHQIKLSFVKESHMKNIGTRKIKKILKKNKCLTKYGLFKRHDKDRIKWYSRKENPILLLIDINGSMVAKCPLIMGGFYDYLQRNYQMNKKSKTTIIDLCKIDEKEKVRNGITVAYNIFESKNISKIITIYYNTTNTIEDIGITFPTSTKKLYKYSTKKCI